ncbi:MAG: energy-coupling factor ABC transporter permease [Burkholderiaceae bacterium]
MFLFDPSGPVIAISFLLAALFCADAVRRAGILQASMRDHMIWALATAAVFLGHQMSINLPGGIELHYMGSAFLALLLGYPRALLSMTLVLLGSALMKGAITSLGVQIFFHAVIPITLMMIISRTIQRTLPPNLFICLLGNGFIGLFLAYAFEHLIALGGRALLISDDLGPGAMTLSDITPYALLLASGEAWLEGMVITVLVVFAPGVVRMFDDAFYLRPPNAPGASDPNNRR